MNKEKKKEKYIKIPLSAENLAYLDSVFYQSYHFTIIAILERFKALGAPLQAVGVTLNKEGKISKTILVGGELLTYLQRIKIGALTVTVGAVIDTARRLNINPLSPLPAAPAQPESLPETDGEKLPE